MNTKNNYVIIIIENVFENIICPQARASYTYVYVGTGPSE